MSSHHYEVVAANFWPPQQEFSHCYNLNCVTIPYLGPPLQMYMYFYSSSVDPDLEVSGVCMWGGGAGGVKKLPKQSISLPKP